MKTAKLNNGLVVFGKTYKNLNGTKKIIPVGYANRTQAEKRKAKIAYEFGVEVYVRGCHPFYLALKEQPSK